MSRQRPEREREISLCTIRIGACWGVSVRSGVRVAKPSFETDPDPFGGSGMVAQGFLTPIYSLVQSFQLVMSAPGAKCELSLESIPPIVCKMIHRSLAEF